MAVEVIMTLEQQVRGTFKALIFYHSSFRKWKGGDLSLLFDWLERNLNPKAACLKRREEEKADDGPKIPQHHMLPNAPYPSMPVSNISFDF